MPVYHKVPLWYAVNIGGPIKPYSDGDVDALVVDDHTLKTNICPQTIEFPIEEAYDVYGIMSVRAKGFILPSWGKPEVLTFYKLLREARDQGNPLPLDFYVEHLDFITTPK